MRKTIVIGLAVALVLAFATSVAAAAPKYSAPDFGQLKPLWPKHPSNPKAESWDAWDRLTDNDWFLCIDKYWGEEDNVCFRSENGDIWFFPANELAPDPRATEWWNFVKNLLLNGDEQVTCLWQAVQLCAGYPSDPVIIHQIIQHMVKLGIVRESQFTRMTEQDIVQAIVQYTDMYWDTWTE